MSTGHQDVIAWRCPPMRGPNSPPRKSPSFTEPDPRMFCTHSTHKAHTDVTPLGPSSPPAAKEETLVQQLTRLVREEEEQRDQETLAAMLADEEYIVAARLAATCEATRRYFLG